MSENSDKTIRQLVKEWLELDRDEATRREIQNLSDKEDYDELEKRLRTRIAFGTAGLRSSMQAGFAHLNPLTIIQASQGLASYLLASVPQTTPPPNSA
ncbi:uncharacterized protein DFL_008634 [Arthrobotrys flagrans]|uniref:Alpha-D-phosphohexomutase alpha/beta/alpha domain-containing protein n=1 Tax=Arthrobotrys flagrans TaxID=97331 RepID=A0A436ZPB2_ARTFL|nr:hypothetical protein DFL_008634 [Arthrobotrys flagrans]